MAKLQRTDEITNGTTQEITCGIIRPISPCDGYPDDHWADVEEILIEVINEAGFSHTLVSEGDAVNLIHERIVTNIYKNEIVICDVSSKNPNVMFELGLRLAFDKPAIIIKDENTSYSFDISSIEHLIYPSSLRYDEIKLFQKKLLKKLKSTYQKSQEDSNFSPFLKRFSVPMVSREIKSKEISEMDYLTSLVKELSQDVQSLKQRNVPLSVLSSKSKTELLLNYLSSHPEVFKALRINDYKDMRNIENIFFREGKIRQQYKDKMENNDDEPPLVPVE